MSFCFFLSLCLWSIMCSQPINLFGNIINGNELNSQWQHNNEFDSGDWNMCQNCGLLTRNGYMSKQISTLGYKDIILKIKYYGSANNPMENGDYCSISYNDGSNTYEALKLNYDDLNANDATKGWRNDGGIVTEIVLTNASDKNSVTIRFENNAVQNCCGDSSNTNDRCYYNQIELFGTTIMDTNSPTEVPTMSPTNNPTSLNPTRVRTYQPSTLPTNTPTLVPSFTPTESTKVPTSVTIFPTKTPTISPAKLPTMLPTISPTEVPSTSPTEIPSVIPTNNPSEESIYNHIISTTSYSTDIPTNLPTTYPSNAPIDTNSDITINTNDTTDTSPATIDYKRYILVVSILILCLALLLITLCIFLKLLYNKQKRKLTTKHSVTNIDTTSNKTINSQKAIQLTSMSDITITGTNNYHITSVSGSNYLNGIHSQNFSDTFNINDINKTDNNHINNDDSIPPTPGGHQYQMSAVKSISYYIDSV